MTLKQNLSSTSRWRRLLKYFAFAIFGFALLLAGLAVLSQTRLFKNWLRGFIVASATKSLNGTLRIASLEGDLWNQITLSHILLESQSDTAFYLPKLEVVYTPRRLLRGEILINHLLIDSLYVKLRQLPDTSWNVSHLVRLEPSAAPSTEPFGWLLTLEDLHLRDAAISIVTLNSSAWLPKRIHEMNVRMSASYSDTAQRVHLQLFRCKTDNPALGLAELSFSSVVANHEIKLQDFILRTARNELKGEGDFNTSDSVASAQFKLNTFDFSEIQLIVPELKLNGNPKISVNIRFQNDSLLAALIVDEQSQHLVFDAALSNFDTMPHYGLTGSLANFNLGHWLGDPSLATSLHGVFRLRGSGAELRQLALQLDADFRASAIMHRNLDSLILRADYAREAVKGNLRLTGDFGRSEWRAQIDDLNRAQNFLINGVIQHFDAGILIPQDSIKTDINLTLSARGHGLSAERLQADTQLYLRPSSIAGVELDSLFAKVHFNQKRCRVDTLDGRSPFGRFSANGEMAFDTQSHLRFSGRLDNLAKVKQALGADTLEAKAFLDGQIYGKIDSLTTEASFVIEDLIYNTMLADSVFGRLLITRSADSLSGWASTQIRKARLSDFPVEAIDLRADLDHRQYLVFLDLMVNDSLSGRLQGKFIPDTLQPRFVIPVMELNIDARKFAGGTDSVGIVFGEGEYAINHLRLAAGEQQLWANGNFSTTGAENLQLQIQNLDVSMLAAFAKLDTMLAGRLNLNAKLQGTPENLMLGGDLALQNGRVNQLAFDSLLINFDYSNKNFRWNLAFAISGEHGLTGEGSLPMNLSWTDTGAVIYEDQPLRVKIETSDLPLELLPAVVKTIQSSQGRVKCGLEIEHTLAKPHVSGFLTLADAAFKYPKYGINYSDLQMQLSFDDTTLNLAHFQARSGMGSLKASGNARFDQSIKTGKLSAMNFDLSAENFLVANNQNLDALISGALKFTGTLEKSEYNGAITVLRSRFYLPAFIENETAATDASLPLLVAATKTPDTTRIEAADSTKTPERALPDYLKNMRGSLKVDIPRNLWLRSPELNVEIAGDLELVKAGPNFEIFGDVRTQRGTYNVFYKQLEIVNGLFLFQGGEKYDPQIDLEAKYVFRDTEQQKRELLLAITGKASEPILEFTMDGQAVDKGDAASYILFGKSVDELSGTKATAGETGLLVGLASQQLSATLGEATGLDMIEIRGQSLSQGTVAVGKYLTNDLFLSYEQQYGSKDSNPSSSKLVTLEYELLKLLRFKLISGDPKKTGVDVFLKFEK